MGNPIIYQAITKQSPFEWLQISKQDYDTWMYDPDIQAVRTLEVSGFASRRCIQDEIRSNLLKRMEPMIQELVHENTYQIYDVMEVLLNTDWKQLNLEEKY